MHPKVSPLNNQLVSRLQKWLSSEEGETLRRLIRDIAVIEECRALDAMREASDDNSVEKTVLECSFAAKQHRFCNDLLEAIRTGKIGEKEFEYIHVDTVLLDPITEPETP